MNEIRVKDFSLKHTIECGQFFMYELKDDFYYVISNENIFKVKQKDDILFYEGISERELVHFFSLDEDLKELTKDFDDEYLLIALEKYWGLRLIRQDLWQCIIGFVLSSASNIPKIKMSFNNICKEFGSKVVFDDEVFYTIPKLGSLNDLNKLKDCKCGYRAKFLFEINTILTKDLLNEIKSSDYESSKKLLMTLPGIGSKVADCICLFSLGHKDAFPIDTWVKQIIEKLYLGRDAKNMKEIEEFISNYFNGHKGLKQQYLFHYMRNL